MASYANNATAAKFGSHSILTLFTLPATDKHVGEGGWSKHPYPLILLNTYRPYLCSILPAWYHTRRDTDHGYSGIVKQSRAPLRAQYNCLYYKNTTERLSQSESEAPNRPLSNMRDIEIDLQRMPSSIRHRPLGEFGFNGSNQPFIAQRIRWEERVASRQCIDNVISFALKC